MPSRHIETARGDLVARMATTVNTHRRNSALHKEIVSKAGPVAGFESLGQLQRMTVQGQQAVASYRAEVESLLDAIRKRAIRPKGVASERALADVARMFERGADVQAIGQWILAEHKEQARDYFAALREEIGQRAYAAKRDNPQSPEPARVIKDQSEIAHIFEKEVMTPDELEAEQELAEAEGAAAYMMQNVDNLERYFQSELNGGPRTSLTALWAWPHKGMTAAHIALEPEPLPSGLPRPVMP